MTVAYEMRGLTKTYPGRATLANDNIDLTIDAGETFCLLGANGSGKSTLVRQLAGLAVPDSGTLSLFGHDMRTRQGELTTLIGYMPQATFALNHLTVAEAIYYAGHLRGLSRAAARRTRDELIATFRLESCARQTARQLSGGQKRMLQFTLALVGTPPILVLDEPTNDLDPEHRRRVWDICADLRRAGETTIVIITHDVIEVERVVDRVGIMRDGRLIDVAELADLRRRMGDLLRLEVSGSEGPPDPLLGFGEWQQGTDGRWLLWLESSSASHAVAQLSGRQLSTMRLAAMNLEDMFLAFARDTTSARRESAHEPC
ncbi:ABC transporter ATP-binding protein [Streptomyces hygroscopicus]|uniref:ABC transporter ATP-binding protein n=1 Tax=Streptomyces hygroscopicus TaxID=1912 RepID=UPI000766ECD4|nr:ABC transporter ATP-binding protein [Streptomyces hygroscopicus]GLV78347.1 ABC transporter ATP-binding protein [Streptomyces hygroscopicus subsp. hygroscopicus]